MEQNQPAPPPRATKTKPMNPYSTDAMESQLARHRSRRECTASIYELVCLDLPWIWGNMMDESIRVASVRYAFQPFSVNRP